MASRLIVAKTFKKKRKEKKNSCWAHVVSIGKVRGSSLLLGRVVQVHLSQELTQGSVHTDSNEQAHIHSQI